MEQNEHDANKALAERQAYAEYIQQTVCGNESDAYPLSFKAWAEERKLMAERRKRFLAARRTR